MIILLFFNILNIYVKYNSTYIECTKDRPCNYSFALTQILDHDIVFLRDSKIQQADHLIDFHSFIETISSMQMSNIEIFSENTKIDGSLFPSIFPYFISISNSKISINNFFFRNFHQSIISYSNSFGSFVDNVVFEYNDLKNKNSIITSEDSNVCILNSFFRNTFKYDSIFFKLKSSNIILSECNFMNISMPSSTNSHLFILDKTLLYLNNSDFSSMNLINSKFIFGTNKSIIKFYRSKICENVFDTLVQIEKDTSLIFNNSYIYKNRGRIASVTQNGFFLMANSDIVDNVSPGSELIFCRNSRGRITDCIFLSNDVDSIYSIEESSGLIFKSNSFTTNYATSSLMQAKSMSKFHLRDCLFRSNVALNSIFSLAENSIGDVSDIEFHDLSFAAAKITLSSACELRNASFFGYPFLGESLFVVKNDSYLLMSSLDVNVQSTNCPLIDFVRSNVLVNNSQFAGSPSETFAQKIECNNCSFARQNEKPVLAWRISYFRSFFILICSFAMFEFGKLILDCYYCFQNNVE